MIKSISLLMVNLLIILSVQAQKKINWNGEDQLTWNNFKMKAPNDHFAAALSAIQYYMAVELVGNNLEIQIENALLPKKSWVRKDSKNDYILNHEQVHFDIMEVYVRKFRAEMKTQKLTSKNAELILKRLYKKYNELSSDAEHRYDEETNHSLKKVQQAQWNEKVSKELKELKAHSNSNIVITITE